MNLKRRNAYPNTFASLIPSWYLLTTLFASVYGQSGPSGWTATPFNSPSLPLAVRSPFLNGWRPQGNGPGAAGDAWTYTWPVNSTLGWYAAINVDKVSYRIFGDAATANITEATQTAVEFSPTRTSFLLSAGPMQVNMSFLNPVMPNDLVNQSLPFSYFYISTETTDGQPHSVQLYSDISGEWISGDNSVNITWSTQEVGDIFYIEATPSIPLAYTTISQHAQDATSYYALQKPEGASLTWQTTQDSLARGNFTTLGAVLNVTDPKPHPVDGNGDFPVFGIAVDLGNITSTPSPVVYAIGLVRDPVVQVVSDSGTMTQRSSYFWSTYSSVQDIIIDFLTDFPNALHTSSLFDSKLVHDSLSYGSRLTDLLSLTVLQVLATIEITISRNSDGSWNTSDVTAFMDDMETVGSAGGVNAVDTIYAALPALLYLNPAILGYLLKPLLTYQNSAQYTLPYAAQNIGAFYPNATGNNSPHNYGIEETGEMLILALAHSQATGDTGLINGHYDLLQSWANYLVNNSLNPGVQRSQDLDQFSTVNQTNLALKGIIGIGAMSKISYSTGHSNDGDDFQNIASSYIQQWQNLTMSSDKSHLRMAFGQDQTSGLMYNLYADKLLNLNLVPSEVYDVQSSFCANQAAAAQNRYGLPLDNSDPQLSRSDWMMYSAATTTDTSTRDFLVSQIWQYASSSQGNLPFSVVYDPTTGLSRNGGNSAAQGAMFAFLALDGKTSSGGQSGGTGNDNNGKKHSNAGAIFGGVIGTLLGVGAVAFLGFFLYRRRRRQTLAYDRTGFDLNDKSEDAGFAPGVVLSAPQTFHPTSLTYADSTSSRDARERVLSFNSNSNSNSVSNSNSNANTVSSPTSPATMITMTTLTKRYSHVPHASSSGEHLLSEEASRDANNAATVATYDHPGPSYAASSTVVESSAGDRVVEDMIQPSDEVRAKQAMAYEELSSEVERLRQEMERMRQERHSSTSQFAPEDEAPPSYVPHLS